MHYLKIIAAPGDPDDPKTPFRLVPIHDFTEIRFHRNRNVHSKPVTVRCGEDVFELSADFMVFVLNARGNVIAGFDATWSFSGKGDVQHENVLEQLIEATTHAEKEPLK